MTRIRSRTPRYVVNFNFFRKPKLRLEHIGDDFVAFVDKGKDTMQLKSWTSKPMATAFTKNLSEIAGIKFINNVKEN